MDDIPTTDSLPTFQPRRGRTRCRRTDAVATVPVVLARGAGGFALAAHPTNSAGPGVAHVGAMPTTTGQASAQSGSTPMAEAYSACMRAHGVPKFPDPDSNGGMHLRAGPGTGIDPSSPQFQAAQKACQSLQPGGARGEMVPDGPAGSGLIGSGK